MTDTQHISARIDRETAERLRTIALTEDRSQSSVVRRALREHLSGRHPPRVHAPDHNLAKEAA